MSGPFFDALEQVRTDSRVTRGMLKAANMPIGDVPCEGEQAVALIQALDRIKRRQGLDLSAK